MTEVMLQQMLYLVRIFNLDKWNLEMTSRFGLKRLTKILTALILLVVMVMSSIGMMTSATSWSDTIYTCIWCLTLVMITDRIEKI